MDLVKKCFAVPPFQGADFAFDKFFLDGGIGRNGVYHFKKFVANPKNEKGRREDGHVALWCTPQYGREKAAF